MHIPDGMLSTPVAAASALTGAGAVGYAVRWVRKNLSERSTVLVSVMAALVFALQMLNFPIAPGISGHFAGGAAVAMLLGPWAAVVVMTTVLIVQAFVFADGGVLALGANVVNLALIGPLAGHLIWRLARGFASGSRARMATASFASAWVAVVSASLAVGFEVWLSGRVSLLPALLALGGSHALVGIGEGVITAGLVTFIAGVRPDLLSEEAAAPSSAIASVAVGAFAVVAVGVSWLASAYPDALESVAAGAGFGGGRTLDSSPLAQYVVPGMRDETLAGVLAGLAGVVLVGVGLYALVRSLANRRSAAHLPALHHHRHEHAAEPEHEHAHHHPAVGHEHAHTLAFERYTYIVSPVHSLDARAKLVATLLFVLGIVLTAAPGAVEFAVLVAVLAGVCLLARVPVTAVLARSLFVLPVAVSIALFAPLTAGGWQLGWTIVSKAWLSALAVLVLSATTPPARLLSGMRSLGMPAVFVSTLTFLYRFATVLGDQVASMRRAIASRAPGLAPGRRVRLYGNLAGNLFVRAYERGERLHAAMLSRGFTGALPAAEAPALRIFDVAVVLAVLCLALATALY